MKKVILSIVVIATFVFTSCKNDTKKETKTTTIETPKEMAMQAISFGVRGNCGMCKTTIEKAAKSLEGVASVFWDVNQKKIDVIFDTNKTDVIQIQKAIAVSGYDTEKVTGNEEAYKNLPGCCKYDREMAMNQINHKDDEYKEEDHSNHNH